MSTEHNPFAALLDGVPRYSCTNAGDMEDDPFGKFVFRSDILAALAAAVPADLAEAGKVLEGVTGTSWAYRPGHYDDWGVVKEEDCVICQVRHPDRIASEVLSEWRAKGQDPWEANARFIAWCREGVPALLARIAAQEAETHKVRRFLKISRDEGKEALERAEAAETALAGMTKERDDWKEAAARAEQEERIRTRQLADTDTALAASEARVAKLVEALETISEYDTGATAGLAYTARAAITEASQ